MGQQYLQAQCHWFDSQFLFATCSGVYRYSKTLNLHNSANMYCKEINKWSQHNSFLRYVVFSNTWMTIAVLEHHQTTTIFPVCSTFPSVCPSFFLSLLEPMFCAFGFPSSFSSEIWLQPLVVFFFCHAQVKYVVDLKNQDWPPLIYTRSFLPNFTYYFTLVSLWIKHYLKRFWGCMCVFWMWTHCSSYCVSVHTEFALQQQECDHTPADRCRVLCDCLCERSL